MWPHIGGLIKTSRRRGTVGRRWWGAGSVVVRIVLQATPRPKEFVGIVEMAGHTLLGAERYIYSDAEAVVKIPTERERRGQS